MQIPFNKPHMTGKELWYISQAHHNGQLSGDGPFTKRCHDLLQTMTGCPTVLLTHSCTGALEMAAILAGIKPGDEVIIPSYTFVTTANAFVLRGATPVFVDVRPDTLNIDETKIEAAITDKTVAIVAVHYAGVGCEMDAIMAIAEKHGLLVIEDAAQGLLASYKGRALGTIGHFGTVSFHETKNITSGEGGALFINDGRFAERAEIVREKGTNRSRFFRGQVDKYTWVDIGSSYLPGELIAAFLCAQLEEARRITDRRLAIWQRYHDRFSQSGAYRSFRLPIVPESCVHNAHMYYLVLPDLARRSRFIKEMAAAGISTVFHYIPLHDAPAGQAHGRVAGGMKVTESVSERLVRLPLWIDMKAGEIDHVIESVGGWLRQNCETL